MNSTDRDKAREIMAAFVDDEYLATQLGMEDAITTALAEVRRETWEAAIGVASAELIRSAELWKGAASLPVPDTSAMKVYNGRQLAAGTITAALESAKEKDVTESESDIPQQYIEFCRAVGRLAKEYKLHDLKADFNPGFDSPWRERIEMSWNSGRHYADVNKVHITSIRHLNTVIEEQDEQGN